MAILSKDGQLIANASQRTIVFDSEENFNEFRASLPSGANIFQSFDIYIRESGQMYAAGVPFKLRETVEAPTELHVTVNGKGDGRPTAPLGPYDLFAKLRGLAANYDFNFNEINIYFAPGTYPSLQIFDDFLNCGGINIMPEPGYEELHVKDDEYVGTTFDDTNTVVFSAQHGSGISAGYTISARTNTMVNVMNVGIVVRDGGVQARGGECQINLTGCAFQATGAVPMNAGYYAFVNATDSATITIGTTYGVINQPWINLEFLGNEDNRIFLHDAMFMADFNGIIRFAFRNDLFKTTLPDGNFAMFTGKRAIFMASDLGTINMEGVKKQSSITTGSIDAGNSDIMQRYDTAGWVVSKRNGVMYLPADGNVPHKTNACCDNTATLIKEGEE